MYRKSLVVAVCTVLLAPPALADGCYARRFSAHDLAAHPGQVVASMRVMLGVDKFGALSGVMGVVAADSGRARAKGYGGRSFIQYLNCNSYSGVIKCSAECDGGLMTVLRKDDAVLEFRTRSFLVGNRTEACSTETLNLAAPDGGEAVFRLDRADDTACRGL